MGAGTMPTTNRVVNPRSSPVQKVQGGCLFHIVWGELIAPPRWRSGFAQKRPTLWRTLSASEGVASQTQCPM